MASFMLDDIVIDRIQFGFAESSTGTPLYTLTQLSDATIDITAETKEAKSADGSLIKKFYQGKAGTFTATNAMINLNVVGAMSGSGKEVAGAGNEIVMPKIVTVKAGTTIELKDYVVGSVKVNGLATNGTMSTTNYTLGTSASATEFVISEDGVLTPPTDENETQYVVKYNRTVTDGIAIKNKSDKFPSTVRLTLKALCIEPCSPDVLRACYIVIPSFQVSPELSLSLNTEGTVEYKGDLQTDFCSVDKTLYEIYMCADDEE